MPELPDVEVFKRYLDATSLHQRIGRARVTSEKILGRISRRNLERRLRGRQLRSSRRHGKYLFVDLDRGGWLVLHFGMTGFLRYFKHEPNDLQHVRMQLDFANGYHLAYVCQRLLGLVDLADDPEAFIKGRELGIDALSPQLDLESFRRLLAGRRGTIKSALMNQHVLAGIGNIYSDEILFQARVYPKASPRRLGDRVIEDLFKQRRTALETAIRCRVDPERFPDSYLLPHRDTDERCPRCDANLKREKISGRTCHYCPRCQRRR